MLSALCRMYDTLSTPEYNCSVAILFFPLILEECRQKEIVFDIICFFFISNIFFFILEKQLHHIWLVCTAFGVVNYSINPNNFHSL